MPRFIDFSAHKKGLGIMVDIDKILKMQDYDNSTKLCLTFSSFEVEVNFERKEARAGELMKHLADGNPDISSFMDSIRGVSSHNI